MGPEPGRGHSPFVVRRLVDSRAYRERVEAAERLGISLRRLDGWESTEVTTHEYDQAGRLVRSVTVREAEWDTEQADIMLALGEYRTLSCPGCGGHLPDTTAGSNPDAYTVDLPIRCHRCTAIAIAHEQYRESPQPQALHFTTSRKETSGG